MEKYARQALAEGCKHSEDLVVTMDSELFRHLNLHYNRNNQIELMRRAGHVVCIQHSGATPRPKPRYEDC
ncbi:hypothetical protein Btru_012060 [Bulinus truncatus]|nr:hypothetical protein Btru_012060 [Bulinus truncatus]